MRYATLILTSNWIEWLNYPGLEVWKFANLGIFLTAAILVVRKPLKQALLRRQEAIKTELLKARAERDEAQAKLDEAEKLLSRVDIDVKNLKDHAREEADQERQRLVAAAEEEIRKLELQGQREMDMAYKVALKELREFLANRSVEHARESITMQLRPEDDARIISSGLDEMRRARV